MRGKGRAWFGDGSACDEDKRPGGFMKIKGTWKRKKMKENKGEGPTNDEGEEEESKTGAEGEEDG